MRFGYADPPYPGMGKKYEEGVETDHVRLLGLLESQFPDGWALSTSSPALRDVLNAAPSDVRVAAWVKPFASFKPGVNPAYAWEPIIFRGGRKRDRSHPTVRDWVSANITLKKGLTGAKPVQFCYWLFDLLGMEDGDEFIDIFPGTGIVERAWVEWKTQRAYESRIQ